MSYLHPDGSPDTELEILESTRCFVVALGQLLRPNEGMVVELLEQPNSTDPFGKYIVWADTANELIRVSKLEQDDELYSAENGQMLWVDIPQILH